MDSQDVIESSHGCLIQHGSYNDRIYVIKTPSKASPSLANDLIELAEKRGYSKIFAKVQEHVSGMFFNAGFYEEARIPNYYLGEESALLMGYFLTPDRLKEPREDEIESILEIALKKAGRGTANTLEAGCVLRDCKLADAAQLARIYDAVFPSYPFPIQDPEYIRKTMNSHVDYFGIEVQGELVAVSSAEMDKEAASVEMTDFATRPEWRGHGFAQHLLLRMEEAMARKGMQTGYTIARAISAGMNITFSKSGYTYGGRLKNNTNISGQIESMNIWHKALTRDPSPHLL